MLSCGGGGGWKHLHETSAGLWWCWGQELLLLDAQPRVWLDKRPRVCGNVFGAAQDPTKMAAGTMLRRLLHLRPAGRSGDELWIMAGWVGIFSICNFFFCHCASCKCAGSRKFKIIIKILPGNWALRQEWSFYLEASHTNASEIYIQFMAAGSFQCLLGSNASPILLNDDSTDYDHRKQIIFHEEDHNNRCCDYRLRWSNIDF